ncbi:GTPase [Okeania sp.]|uniref:GTPase n=1 Tax=Okeania sp. TaxID=3100323 RepID=UPI002B4B438A|nr:GTPase [Okeania sp.]MEB3343341.1 GTPase [Okeania sp.]
MKQSENQDLDYPFLLVTHIVCADQQIHSEESKALDELAKQSQVGTRTLAEMEKILAQDEQQLSVAEIALRVAPKQRNETMWQMLSIAYVDGFCSTLERQMAQQVAQIWGWSDGELERQIEETGAFADTRFIVGGNKEEVSLGARMLKNADSLLSKALVDKLATFSRKQQKVEQLRREILLSGLEYDEVIHQCAVIAEEDYLFGERALKYTDKALQNLGISLQKAIAEIKDKSSEKGANSPAEEVANQLEGICKELTAKIIKKIDGVRESLCSKERALNHFSIAFMGKTKVGKSTLHAIITNNGWDAIGVGKQRTTRFNRVYEWKNIRVIDTPGIGAPGGKSDEEIAKSIIDESDVICYVVTNDSIQESEFSFLGLLKQKAKPLIILLNVKYNLRDNRRLEYFLNNPNKLFEMKGKSGIGGHINRIRSYAQKYYGNDYFSIVPVMLLAAQISVETEDKRRKNELFQASRIQDFLDSLRESLMKDGKIRRSQTLLGSTVGAIEDPLKWLRLLSEVYANLAQVLKNKREEIEKKIYRSRQNCLLFLVQEIKIVFEDALNIIPSFAEDYWDKNDRELKEGWQTKIKEIDLEKRLESCYKLASEKFNREVTEVVEEVGSELQLIAQSEAFDLSEQDASFLDNSFVRIASSFVLIAGTIFTFLTPVGIFAGLTLGIFGTVLTTINGLFKSIDQRRTEAFQKIFESLSNQVIFQRETTVKKFESEFSKSCQLVSENIDDYFDNLSRELEKISEESELTKRKLESGVNYLNRAYAKRIIDLLTENYEPLAEVRINEIIGKVRREFGKKIIISTKTQVPISKTSEEINLVIQEDVTIKYIK